MSSQLRTIPCSMGWVTWRKLRAEAASSPIMISLMMEDPTRSSARRMGRPTIEGNTRDELSGYCFIEDVCKDIWRTMFWEVGTCVTYFHELAGYADQRAVISWMLEQYLLPYHCQLPTGVLNPFNGSKDWCKWSRRDFRPYLWCFGWSATTLKVIVQYHHVVCQSCDWQLPKDLNESSRMVMSPSHDDIDNFQHGDQLLEEVSPPNTYTWSYRMNCTDSPRFYDHCTSSYLIFNWYHPTRDVQIAQQWILHIVSSATFTLQILY